MDDIIKDQLKAMLAIDSALDRAEQTFEFGVDKTKWGYRLTVNYRPQGIYLYSNAVDFRRQRTKNYYDAVIAVDDDRAGRIEVEQLKDVNIYVSIEQFERFCREADQVCALYCRDDFCFRGIPDTWFNDLVLVRFIRDQLRSEPAMSLWFQGRISATSRWLTRPLSD